MKGSAKVLKELNKILAMELAAIDQYFIHARMYQDWGLNKLYERVNHESEDEKGHVSRIIERMLFLEGIPDMKTRTGLNIGKDVQQMLENDLQLELADDKALKDSIKVCEAEQDYQTREILEDLLRDTEEDHTYWLEIQLGLIKRVGLQNYLQSQM
jgi:bacterioferritin